MAVISALNLRRISLDSGQWIALGIFVGAVLYLVQLPRGLDFGDESVLLYEAKRIRDGEVMYRDFFQFVTPLASYAIAAAYWLFGTSMATARGAMAVVHSLTAALLYCAARALGVRRVFAVLVPMAYLGCLQAAWPIVSWHWFSTCFVVVLLWLLVAEPVASAWRWSFAQGVCTGLLIATQQQKGAIVAVGMTVIFLTHAIVRRRYGVRGVWRAAAARIVWFAAGTAIVVVPLLVAFTAVAGWQTVYDALVRFPLENYRANLHARWGKFERNPHLAAVSFPTLLRYAPSATLPPLLVGCVALVRKRCFYMVQQLASLLLLCGVSVVTIWYFPDLFHIAFIAAPFVVCAVLALEWLVESAGTWIGPSADHVGAVVASAFAIMLGVHLARNASYLRLRYPVSYDSAFGRVDLKDPWQRATLEMLRARLDQQQSHNLFCYRNLTGVYLLTGGRNPTRYQYLHARVSPPLHVQDALAVLATEDIPYAVLGRFGKQVDPIADFVLRHYHPLPKPPMAGFSFFYPYERTGQTAGTGMATF